MKISQFLQNNWVFGVCTSLISSAIFYFLTTWLSFKISKRDYSKRIEAANSKVILILKSYLVNNSLPTLNVINAIIASVSREFGVKPIDLYSISIICEELIRQIIENTYISSEIKNNYIKNLMEVLDDNADNVDPKTYLPADLYVFNKTIDLAFSLCVGLVIIVGIMSQTSNLSPETKSVILSALLGIAFFPLFFLARKLTCSLVSLKMSLGTLKEKYCKNSPSTEKHEAEIFDEDEDIAHK